MTKPIILYDTNFFSHASMDDLIDFLNEGENFLTYDVVLELIEAKKKHGNNEKYMEKMKLIFKEDNGLQDNITLLLSHAPFYLGETYENTKNVLDLKNRPVLCSAYHTWFPAVITPALLIDFNRHMNSEILWNIQQGFVTDQKELEEAEEVLGEIRKEELQKIEHIFQNSNIKAKKIINTWKKRKDDIKRDRLKISDCRLIMQGFNLLAGYQQDVIILTGDYDLIDLRNNLLLSIINDYVITEVLNSKAKLLEKKNLDEIEVEIKMQKIMDTYEKVIKKIKQSTDGLKLIIWFYKDSDKKIYPFERTIPFWLLEFALLFKRNTDCYNLDEEIIKLYPYKYIWQLELIDVPSRDKVKFKIWRKKQLKKVANCRFRCKYEFDEMNCPEKISLFTTNWGDD